MNAAGRTPAQAAADAGRPALAHALARKAAAARLPGIPPSPRSGCDDAIHPAFVSLIYAPSDDRALASTKAPPITAIRGRGSVLFS